MFFVSDREERRTPGAVLYAGDRALVVETARPHQQRWLVRFAGVEDRSAAEALRGLVLSAEVLPGEPGTLWVHEMVGAEMADRDGRVLGQVVSVQANPAHDLLVLDDGGLVPVVFVVGVVPSTPSHPARVLVDIPDGLLGG